MAYTEDDIKFLIKIGQISEPPAPIKTDNKPKPTNESEE
jgi:hypothetical protein